MLDFYEESDVRVKVAAVLRSPEGIPMTTPISSPGRRLRDAYSAATIAVPGVFNALVAKIAERLGFQAVYLSGGALSAAYGVPDVGLLTLSEFVAEARTIAQATTLPLLCDADTGFGEVAQCRAHGAHSSKTPEWRGSIWKIRNCPSGAATFRVKP